VAILDDLDTRLPMHAQLLGLDLAIWWDTNTNQWRCAVWHMHHAKYAVGCCPARLLWQTFCLPVGMPRLVTRRDGQS
jgi:hypothetical protein